MITPTAKATNEGSYQQGFWSSSNTGPQNNATLNQYPNFDNDTCRLSHSYTVVSGLVMPAITNKTACIDGWNNGYKQWCDAHALDCVKNITSGEMPPLIMQIHHEYVKGYDAANNTDNPICPIGNNAVFCQGWGDNNGYDDEGCADEPLANITTDLVGCPGDIMTESQIAGLPTLVGNWHFVNASSTQALEPPITGTFLFNSNGYMKMIIPSETGFGPYVLESSWSRL
jgi:hypothetical protein